MASHARFRRLLAARDLLLAAQAAALRRHVAGCSSCRELSAAYQRQDDLLRGLRLPGPPPALRYEIADAARHQKPRHFPRLSLPRLSTPHLTWIGVFLTAIAVLTLGTIHPLSQGAGNGVTNLGKPTNDVPGKGYLPLGKFHRTPVTLKRSGKAELFFLALSPRGPIVGDDNSAIEQWPLVKALGQFGSLSGLTAIDRVCRVLPAGNGIPPGVRSCSDPTLNLAHARYSSHYISLRYVTADVQEFDRARFVVHDSLSASERRLLKPYFHARRHTVNGYTYLATPGFPLMAIRDYVQRGLGNLIPGELDDKTHFGGQGPNGEVYPLGGLPFSKVQQSLRAGHAVDTSVYSAMVHDLNAETNILTALICHADGMRPGSACARPVIKAILKHVHPRAPSLELESSVVTDKTSVTDLGKPTAAHGPNSAHDPLGTFRRVRLNLRQGRTPELLFLGSQIDFNSAAEEWGLVKALGQFGTLSNVQPVKTRACGFSPGGGESCLPRDDRQEAGRWTFNLDRAVYRSPYVGLAYVDLIDHNLQLHKISASRRTLFNRYLRQGNDHSWRAAAWYTAVLSNFDSGPGVLPLIVIGDYLDTGPNFALPGDLQDLNGQPIPFATLHQSMRLDRRIGGEAASVVPDFNAEANLLTALICHADRSQPHSVCSRPAIKTLLKHAK